MITIEELQQIRAGANRWHSVSADTVIKLCDEIDRLHMELIEARMIGTPGTVHPIDVARFQHDAYMKKGKS